MTNLVEYINTLFDSQIRKIPDSDSEQKKNTIELRKVVANFIQKVSEYGGNNSNQKIDWYTSRECENVLLSLNRGDGIMTARIPSGYVTEKNTIKIYQTPSQEESKERREKGYYSDQIIPYVKFSFFDIRGPPDRRRLDIIGKLNMTCYPDSFQVGFHSYVYDVAFSETKQSKPTFPKTNYEKVVKELANGNVPKLLDIVDVFGPFSEKLKNETTSDGGGDLTEYLDFYSDMYSLVVVAKRDVLLNAIDASMRSLSIEYEVSPFDLKLRA